MFESSERPSDLHGEPETDSADVAYWRNRAEEAQSGLARIAKRLRARDQRIALLEQALARTVTLHHTWERHLEHRLDRLSIRAKLSPTLPLPADVQSGHNPSTRAGVAVQLPHTTTTLTAIVDVMWTYWADWDADRPPKSSVVARAIDEKLGLKGQSNGEASRSAQTFAAALRPDSVNEADGRHR